MKKKILCVALAATMALSMIGCGSKNTENQNPTASTGGDTTTTAASQGESKTEESKAGESGIVKTLSKPVTIEFWHPISNEAHVEILNKLIDDFNNGRGKELGITVNSTFQGSSADLYNNVMGALKAKNAPDVALATPQYTAEYLQTDYIVNLDPYINDPDIGISDWDDIFEGFRSEGSSYVKEGTYSIPIHKSAEILYYNKKFFEENSLTVPTTWDEMVEVSQKIYDITGKPAFGWDNLWSAMMTLTLQNGGKYADANGEVFFAEDPTITKQVVEFYKEQVKKGIWRTTNEDKFFSGPFANEIIPMYIGVSVEAAYINQKSDTIQWSAAPIPQKDPNNTFARTDGHCIEIMSMNGDQERIYAAFEFVKYMTSYEANLATAMGSGYLPIRQSVIDSKEYQDYLAQGKDDAQIASNKQTKAYFNPPSFVSDTLTSKGLTDESKIMMENIMDNDMDFDTALAQLKSSLGIK